MASGDNNDDQAQGNANLNDLSKGCQQISIEDNTNVASEAAIKRKKCLRRQKTEQMASCLLDDIKRTILEKKLSNSDIGHSQTFAKETLSRKSSIASTAATNESTDIEDTRTERIFSQQGDGNLMLIWNTTDCKSKNVWKQVGNKNVMIDMDFLSQACQVQDMTGCVIPLDTTGAVWMEIKRRSQVMQQQNSNDNESTTPNQTQNDCGRDPNPQPPSRPPAPSPTNHNIHNSMEENNWYPATDYYAQCRNAAPRNEPVEHCDLSSASPGGNQGREPTENYDSLYDQFEVEEMDDKISVLIKTREGSQRVSDYATLDENPFIDTLLSHPQIVNFISRNASNKMEVSVCELAYEKGQIYSYVNTPAHEDSSVSDDEHYTTVPSSRAPPLPERRYLKSEVENIPVKQHERRNGSPYKENNNNGNPGTSSSPLDGVKRPQNHLSPGTGNHKLRAPSPRRGIPVPPDMTSRADDHMNGNGNIDTTPTMDSSLRPPPRNGQQSPSRTKAPPLRPAAQIPQECLRPWYHGPIDSKDANRRLANMEDGRFLVRDASNRVDPYVRNASEPEHIYTLQFVDNHVVKRLKIMKNRENRYHFEHTHSHNFPTLEDLIQAILTSGLEIREGEREKWKNVSVSPVNVNEF